MIILWSINEPFGLVLWAEFVNPEQIAYVESTLPGIYPLFEWFVLP